MPTARLPIDAAHRAASSDAHAIGAVTGLTDALAGKAAVAHETALTGVHGIVANGTNGYAVGLGVDALKVNTADTNVAIGYKAGQSLATGLNTTAVGSDTLYTNVSGKSNTAVGYRALCVSTGSYCTALGDSAARSCTTAELTAFGANALYAATTGTCSTAVGTNALRYTTGGYNTGVGTQALYRNAGGTYNIAIGYDAGSVLANGSDQNQTPSYATYIGSSVRASVAGATNETVIGYAAIGGGSNTVRFGNASVVAWLPGATNKVALGSSTVAFKEQYMTDGTNTWKLTVDATGPVWTSI